MNKRPLSLLSLSLLLSLPSAMIGCGGDDPPADPGAGGTAGTAGAGGAAGSGAGTAGTAGSAAGTAGSGAGTAGSGAGTAGTAGSGAGTAGSGAGTAGTAGSGGAGGSTGGGMVPTDTTSAGFETFLGTATNYQGAGWVPESAAAREGDSGSPHGRVRVFFNQTMLDSIAADNGPLGNRMPHTEGSMVVKEMYDAGTTVIGRAAILRSGGAYILHCASSEAGTCYSSYVANEIAHGASNCACHTNGVIITPPPM